MLTQFDWVKFHTEIGNYDPRVTTDHFGWDPIFEHQLLGVSLSSMFFSFCHIELSNYLAIIRQLFPHINLLWPPVHKGRWYGLSNLAHTFAQCAHTALPLYVARVRWIVAGTIASPLMNGRTSEFPEIKPETIVPLVSFPSINSRFPLQNQQSKKQAFLLQFHWKAAKRLCKTQAQQWKSYKQTKYFHAG